MPSPAWEDLDDFLQDDDFAFPAVITLAGGGTIALSGILDDPYVGAKLGEYERDTEGPRFTCREDLVMGKVRRKDTITITYPKGAETLDIMTSPQPDGTGMAVLELSRR